MHVHLLFPVVCHVDCDIGVIQLLQCIIAECLNTGKLILPYRPMSASIYVYICIYIIKHVQWYYPGSPCMHPAMDTVDKQEELEEVKRDGAAHG